MNLKKENYKVKLDKDILQAELFEAISHPRRIQILRMLSSDALGFSDLKRKLGLSSSGNLTHHLNKLINLIETDTLGKYKLTDQGREALFALQASNPSSNEWKTLTYAVVSALIFYGLFLTISILTKWYEYIGIYDLIVPLIALFASIIYFLFYRFLLKKEKRS
ncbi:MAG: ArsR/SmtB family transcription factor [Promethearchaeota archaeon]